MPIRFRCPSGHKLAAPEERAGHKARCPKCQETVTIPGVLVVANEPAEDIEGSDKSSAKPPPLKPRGERVTSPPPIPRAADREETLAKPPAAASAELGLINSLDEPRENDAFWTRWISSGSGYRPELARVRTVRWLAAGLAVLTAICLWPALANIGSFGDRLWVSAVVFLSALQLAYIIWMLTVPDWSTLRVMMGVFTCVATAYGTGMAISFSSDPGDSTLLHISGPHARVTLWCGLVVILSGLMVFLLGRCDTAWRRAYSLGGSSRHAAR